MAWVWVGLCTGAIYAIIPVARTIQIFVSAHGGRALFGYFVLVMAAAALSGLIYVLYFRLQVRSAGRYIWLILIAGCYFYFTLKLWKIPETAIHFVQYGLLGYFLFRALTFSTRDKSIYLAAFLIGSFIGTFDEIIQWAVPGRYWDFQDVGLNALSVALIQVALWQGVKPKIISERVRPESFRRVSILFGANLLLLGLCLSNTPRVVAWAARHVPVLAFLEKEEAMSESRYKHKDPEIGVFYSRLTLEDLRKADEVQADQYGQLLWAWKDKAYGDFLLTFPPSVHPFMHELRVHVFRRDRKFDDSQKTQKEGERKSLLFIAYKENQILERYFGRTIQRSPHQWPQERTARLAAAVDRGAFYKSPVSSGISATLRGGTLWAAIGAFLALLILLNYLIRRPSGSRTEKERT